MKSSAASDIARTIFVTGLLISKNKTKPEMTMGYKLLLLST